MRILKTGCGNTQESFIEDRLTDGVNVIFSNDNNKGKMWGDRIFEKCGIRREEEGDGGKTLEIRGKRRLPARDRGANYQQS